METIKIIQRILVTFTAFIVVFFIAFGIVPMLAGAGVVDEIPTVTEPVVETIEPTIPQKTIEEIITEQLKDLQYIAPQTKEEALQGALKCDEYIEYLYSILPPVYETDKYVKALKIVNIDITNTRNIKEQYEIAYDEFLRIEEQIHWENCYKEYPIATEIWDFMRKELNWSNEVCAGVIGNMMAETGGQTLNIRWYCYDSSREYYGICQWSLYYRTFMAETSLAEQLQYLKDSIEETMNKWGYKYAKGFKYKDFVALTDPQEVALAFAKCYERCHHRSYGIRQTNAMKAYDYYTQ